MKKKVATILLALTLILTSTSVAFAASFDLTYSADSTKNYTFNQFIDSPAVFDFVATNLTGYQIEGLDGIKYNAQEINIRTSMGMTFIQAVASLQATAAVVTAEGSKLQADVDVAQALITALPNGTDKTALQDRLNIIIALIPVTPPAPAVTNDDVLNTVIGMQTGMEYNLDGAGYLAYVQSTFDAISFVGNHILLVRVSAAGINPPSADTTLNFTMSVIEAAEIAVAAYEAAPITTLAEVAIAEGLKPAADTAVVAVVDPIAKADFQLRISNKATAIASAKATFQGAEAIAAINNAPDVAAMSLAIATYAPVIGLNLSDYNALPEASKIAVQTAMLAPNFTSIAQIKSTFDNAVLGQKALVAVNTASAATMGSVITTYSSPLGLTSTTLSDYNALSGLSKDIVHAALVGKAFADKIAVNTAFGVAVSVPIVNETTVNATMTTLLIRYRTIFGLDAISYDTYIAIAPNTLTFQSHVNTAIMAAVLNSQTDVQVAFTAAVAAEAVHTIDIQGINFMDRDLRQFASILGLNLTDYDALINKAPILNGMVAEPFTTANQIKTKFDALVASEKALEALPMLDAFNNAADVVAMESVIDIYSNIFKPSDYNALKNSIGATEKLIILNSMLPINFANTKDINMSLVLGLMNNYYINTGKYSFDVNHVLLGLSTNEVSDEFNLLPYLTDQKPIKDAVFASRTILNQAQVVVIALNTTITSDYIGTLLRINSTLLGIDLTAYNLLSPTNKTMVNDALMATPLTNITDVQNTFNAAMSVPMVTLNSIAITTPATKLIYTVGDPLDIAGMIVTGTYSDSSTQVETVTATNVTGFDSTAAVASQILTVTFGAKTTTYTVEIKAAATLSSIAITLPATKLIYTVGDPLDITGMVVTGTYSDASTQVETVTATNITGFDSTAVVASQILTVTVGAKTTTYTVEIKAAPTLSSVAITTPATKLIYTVGDVLDITGMVVTGTYSDTSTQVETIIAANVTGFDSTVAVASQTLTITVGAKTTTYTVEIKAVPTGIPAVGSASAYASDGWRSNTIIYTLTTGKFDAIGGTDVSNWTIVIDTWGDLGAITNVVLSNSDTVATITISGWAYVSNDGYSIAPLQAAYASGFIAQAPVAITVIDAP